MYFMSLLGEEQTELHLIKVISVEAGFLPQKPT